MFYLGNSIAHVKMQTNNYVLKLHFHRSIICTSQFINNQAWTFNRLFAFVDINITGISLCSRLK